MEAEKSMLTALACARNLTFTIPDCGCCPIRKKPGYWVVNGNRKGQAMPDTDANE
jgi:hypothetical protein